jgi:glycosyltransferase involved in cell wall biosynthesis
MKDTLVTTTNGQLNYFIERKSVPEKTIVIPNGVSENLVKELTAVKTSNQNNSEFMVVYIGLIGFPQGLSTIVKAAKLLPEVTFYLVGDGAERSELERIAKNETINNIHFTGYVSLSEVIKYYKMADILVASLRKDPVFEITQPSKIWEYMTAGKAIVYSGAGEAANAIEKSQSGIVVPPEEPEAFAEAVRQLYQNTPLRLSFGENGRDHALKNLQREKILVQLDNLLNELI